MPLVPQVKMSPNGPLVSKLVQGYWRLNAWQMNPQQRLTFLKQHIDLGITTVDHAHVYGPPSCEALFGDTLKLQPSIRNEIQIISKCGIKLVNGSENNHQVSHYTSFRKDILSSVETSLQRLNVEHLDILLLHRPDWLMDVDEIAAVFTELKLSGKVSYFGVSNFSASQFTLLQSRLEQPLVTNQVEINPLNIDVTNDGTLDQMQQLRVRPMAWSCLGGGRIFTDKTEQIKRLNQTLSLVAEEISAQSIDQVLYAWVLKLPAKPIAVLGSGKIERTTLAVESIQLNLTREQWYRIWVAAKGHGVP
jgi:predicted oxidoreductase